MYERTTSITLLTQFFSGELQLFIDYECPYTGPMQELSFTLLRDSKFNINSYLNYKENNTETRLTGKHVEKLFNKVVFGLGVHRDQVRAHVPTMALQEQGNNTFILYQVPYSILTTDTVLCQGGSLHTPLRCNFVKIQILVYQMKDHCLESACI